MRGTAKTCYPYTLEDDENSPKEDVSTFYVNAYGGFDDGEVSSGYQAAQKIGRKGRIEPDKGRWKKATKELWMKTIEKVENFAFSDDFSEYGDKFHNVIDHSDEQMLMDVGADLTLEQVQEIFEYARNISSLGHRERKNSNTVSGSTSGDKKTKAE